MSDSEDSDSILPTLQKTRDLWSQKSEGDSLNYLAPKSYSPTKPTKSPSPVTENHVNGMQADENVVRSEDKNDDDFDMPDVKSMKSQWEKAGPIPAPKKSAPVVQRKEPAIHNHNDAELLPVNRKQEDTEEEYDVKLGALREKFELEAKAASSSKVVWNDGPKPSVSKKAVGEKKSIFEVEIEAQKHYHSTKEGPVEMPVVKLSSIKHQFEQRKDEKMVVPMRPSSSNSRKSRETSISSDSSTPAAEIVKYDDPPTQEEKYEVEISSLRKRFEQGGASAVKPAPMSRRPVQKKVPDPSPERKRAASESDNVSEIVRSSESRYEEMIGEESVKDRLARYKSMTEAASPQKTQKSSKKISNLVIKPQPVEEESQAVTRTEQDQEIVRSPPAGTKEKPDYKASIDLEQARQLFEQRSTSPTRSGRSSRSSSGSPRRRAPRSQSTPSPIHRGSSTSSRSSKSSSPNRPASPRSSAPSSRSGRSSGRASPTKKFGDPDVVVLEHAEVNYYYENGTRVSTKTKGPDDLDKESDDMEIVKPAPAGTKEQPDFVPSVNLHSVRDMFDHPKEEDFSRGRAPPKKVIIERQVEDESNGNSPVHNPNIVRSTTAGTREEVAFEMSIDLKTARSRFESPHRLESYVPRNKIREREEESRRQRVAAAAASPRSSESSDSGYEVVKPTEAGSKENPDYQVDLKAAKQKFEGGKAPVPMKRETKARQQPELKGEVIRPEPAGTKEIVEIRTSNDVKSAKMKFQNLTQDENETGRKSPIDIQEEARMVIRKEREVAEEVQKPNEEPEKPAQESSSSSDSESEHANTEHEAIVEPDNQSHEDVSLTVSDRHVSVSSEELVEKGEEVVVTAPEEHLEDASAREHTDEQEQQQQQDEDEEEAPATAVTPVRVVIPESLTEKEKEEAEPPQDYGTYAKVIDYNEDIQHTPQSSSDSESDKESEIKDEVIDLHQEEGNISVDDDLKQNGLDDEDNVDSSYESNEVVNHLEDSLSTDDQKGISSSSSNQDDDLQQQLSLSSSSQAEGEEIPGKTNNVTNNSGDIFGVLSQTNDSQPSKTDPFGDLGSLVSPPQLLPELNQPDPFGADPAPSNDPFDPFSSNPVPPPRHIKKVEPSPAVKQSGSSLIETSDDEDYDKPHFNYPFDEASPPKPEAPTENSNNSNGVDIFGDMSWDPVTPSGKSDSPPAANSDLLGIFDSNPSNAQSGNDLLADFGSGGAAGSINVDPFDIFAKPTDQTSSSIEKDPFDLFA